MSQAIGTVFCPYWVSICIHGVIRFALVRYVLQIFLVLLDREFYYTPEIAHAIPSAGLDGFCGAHCFIAGFVAVPVNTFVILDQQ
jgi:hypothetical protein